MHNIPVGDQTISLTILPTNENGVHANNNQTNQDETQKHFLGVLNPTGTNATNVTNSGSSITSAMQILKEGEQQWLNSEVMYIFIIIFILE